MRHIILWLVGVGGFFTNIHCTDIDEQMDALPADICNKMAHVLHVLLVQSLCMDQTVSLTALHAPLDSML